MALADIINAIKDQTATQQQTMLKENEAELKALESDWEAKINDKKQNILAENKRLVEQKIQQSHFLISNKVKTATINKKYEIIDQLFADTADKLAKFDDKAYQDIIEKLVAKLPKLETGIIKVPAGKEKITQATLKQAGLKYDLDKKNIKSIGGFVFTSDDIDIDYQFESLMHNIKNNHLVDITNALFN